MLPTSDFEYIMPVRILYGPNSSAKVGAELEKLGVTRPMLVTDPGAVRAGLADKILSQLSESSVKVTMYDKVEANPTLESVEAGFDLYRKSGCDSLIGLGGGSSMDSAKVIGVQATNPKPLLEYVGINKVENRIPPMIAIPTTTGTGSETTQVAVVTDRVKNAKLPIRAVKVYADVAILDPLLLATLPAPLAASTGIDALTHAVEGYVSIQSEPITDALLIHAIEMIGKYLRPFVANRKNLEAAGNMLIASNIAGIGFGNSRVGVVHAVAHPLGGRFNVAHGVANALMLPVCMQYNLIACPEKFVDIARALGEPVEGVPVREAAQSAVDAVRQLAEDIGVPKSLRELGVPQDALEVMARDAMEQGVAVTNPRTVTEQDCVDLYRQVY
jgi:alcohol dehydrogenase class IV